MPWAGEKAVGLRLSESKPGFIGENDALPYVKIEMLPGRTEDQKAAIAEAVTDAIVRFGNASPASVWVVFDDVPAQNWASGGELLSRKGKTPPPPGGGRAG